MNGDGWGPSDTGRRGCSPRSSPVAPPCPDPVWSMWSLYHDNHPHSGSSSTPPPLSGRVSSLPSRPAPGPSLSPFLSRGCRRWFQTGRGPDTQDGSVRRDDGRPASVEKGNGRRSAEEVRRRRRGVHRGRVVDRPRHDTLGLRRRLRGGKGVVEGHPRRGPPKVHLSSDDRPDHP